MTQESLQKFQKVEVKNYNFGDEEKLGVDARSLWEALGSKQEFSNWVKNRIRDLELVEGKDFFTFDKIIKRENMGGGSKAIEYTITLNQAKHFAQLEKTETGKAVRQYLIDAEEELQKIKHDALPEMKKPPKSLQEFARRRKEVYEILKHEMRIARYSRDRKLTSDEKQAVAREVQRSTGETVYIDYFSSNGPLAETYPDNTALNVTDFGLWFRHFESMSSWHRSRCVNRLLTNIGLQKNVKDTHGNKRYEPTKKAKENGLVYIHGVRLSSNGDKGTVQLLWYPVKTIKYISKVKNYSIEDLVSSPVLPNVVDPGRRSLPAVIPRRLGE